MKLEMKPEFYKTKLDNGLTILFEKRDLPIITILYSSRFGSAYESAKLKGIAHAIEHMVFKGTKKRSQKEIASTIEKKGGLLNAFTAEQQITFWTKIPSKHSNLGFEILSDMMLNPLFDKNELEKEKKVILEEQKKWHDVPEYYILIKIKNALYKSPFGLSPFGSQQTLKRIKKEDLVLFHKNNLSNGILTIVGNGEFDNIIEQVKEKFKISKKITEKKPVINRINKTLIEKRAGLDQIHLALGTHMPSLSDKMRYGAEIISSILGSGMSSRLWQEVREKRGLAYSINSFVEEERSYGNLIIYAGINKNHLKDVKEIILKEIKKLQNLKQKELEETKEQLIGNFYLNNEKSESVAQMLVLNEIATEAEEFYRYPEKISQVKLDDVKRLAKIKDYSFAALVPK